MNDDAKRASARAAVSELPEEGILGLGTGSTVRFVLEAVAERVRAGHRYVGVPTSDATRRLATELGIPLLADDGPWHIDVTIDGADEVDRNLALLKGKGNALTREKIVAQASRAMFVVADESKMSARLGERSNVSVEVLAFACKQTVARLGELGAATLRADARSDAGGFLVDLVTGPIDDPAALDTKIRAIPGVVETGIFLGRADVVFVGSPAGTRRVAR